MMKKKLIISILFICISISVICIVYFSLWTGKKNICIAVASTFSGKYQDYGNEMLRGIQLYVDQINATGGVKGSIIKLLVFDDKGTKKGADKVAKSIVNNKKIRFVLGHYLSSCSLRAAPVYEKNMMPSITSSATLDELTTNNDWLFRIVPPNSYHAKFIITYAKSNVNVKKACVIYETDAYALGLLKMFTKKASELCVDISKKISIDSAKKDINQQIKDIVKTIKNIKDIDIIFVSTHATIAANLIVQLRKNKCNQIIMGADSMASNFFLKALAFYQKKYSFSDIYTNSIYSVTWFHQYLSEKSYADFAQAYMNQYDLKPSLISTSAYDLAHVTITALKSIDFDRSSRTIKKQFKQALENYYDRYHCVKGLTGNIFFDASGDMKKSTIVLELHNGHYIPSFKQYISVPYEDISDHIIQKGIDESIIANDDDEFFTNTNLAFVTTDNIHFSQIDLKNQTFHAKFDIKFRYKKTFHPENIQFMNAAYPIVLEKPIKRIQHTDDSETIIYTVESTFIHDINDKKYPFDTQTLSISLRDKQHSMDKIMLAAENHKPVSFTLDSDQYSPLYLYSYIEKHEISSEKNKIFSRYNVTLHTKTKFTEKNMTELLPLCIAAFIVYLGYFFPVKRMDISMIVNLLILMINAYFQINFNNPLPQIIFTEYLYIFMYVCIGFSLCFQAFLLTFYLKQLNRTVAVFRIVGIILYPIMITGAVFLAIIFSQS